MSGSTEGTVNIEELSDEDFLNMDTSVIVEAMAEGVIETPVETPETEQQGAAAEGETGAEAVEGEEGQGGGDTTRTEGDEGDPAPEAAKEEPKPGEPEAKPTEGDVPALGSKPEGEAKEDKPAAVEGFTPPTPEEATSFMMQVMTPFKANGKTITLKDPKEVIQLMQMGANYTRKMQDIQPHRKVLTMLQNNDLLDEGKLDLLIGVSKKDPEAIKRFLKDAGIDPLDIDTSSEPTYVEGSHKVSDTEVAFNTSVEELVSSEGGSETLSMIRTTWDQASKDALWEDPSLMAAIHQQKQSGVYDMIADEVNRLTTLGQIPPNTSFIRAYQVVGDHLAKSGATIPEGTSEAPEPKPVPAAKPAPLATRTVAPKAKVENSDRAGAAAPSRTSAKPAKVLVNPLAVPDEDFMANLSNFQGRI